MQQADGQGEAEGQHRGGSHLCIRQQRHSIHSPIHRSQSRARQVKPYRLDIIPTIPAPGAPSRPRPTSPSQRTCTLQTVRAWERVEEGTISTYREWSYLIPWQPAERGDHLWAEW